MDIHCSVAKQTIGVQDKKGHEFFGWFQAGTNLFYAISSSETLKLG